MEKKVARIIMEHGDGKVVMVRGYKPKADKNNLTTAIRGTRRDINMAIGRVILDGDKDERKAVGKLLIGDYFEDWDSEKNLVIKY